MSVALSVQGSNCRYENGLMSFFERIPQKYHTEKGKTKKELPNRGSS
uniref:Uncharacterized protein n=1 Tax=Myoviridae sp. cta6i12 TaxID=2827695 RepID=A0A8S5T6Z0_9CAUD|nr:MAG TPA: hypothetical protein [Myoviridae sp. cta6i12]